MFTLLRLNARPVIFYLKPGAMRLGAAADLNPAVAIAGSIDHHIRHRALNRERVHFHLDAACLKRSVNLTLIAAFRRNHLAQHGIEIRHLHWHFLTGTQIVNKLFDNGVTLFDVFIDRLREITVFLAHHLRRQTNTGQRRAQVVADARHQ